jgi:hypothetical protein
VRKPGPDSLTKREKDFLEQAGVGEWYIVEWSKANRK